MRHRMRFKALSRTSAHRLSLRRNMAQSLFEHGQVTSTIQKVREVRPFAEKLITLAKKAHQGNLSARQRIIALLNDRAIIPDDHLDDYTGRSDAGRQKVLRARTGRRYRTGQPKGALSYTAQSVVHRLINDVAPRFGDRPGGYTRVIRLGRARVGDGGERAVLQLVGDETPPTGLAKPPKSARERKAEARYAFAARALRAHGRRPGRKEAERKQPPASDQAPGQEQADGSVEAPSADEAAGE